MTRVLFATRAWESPEIEGGYLLLKDVACQLTADGAAEFEACFLALRDGEDHGINLLPAFQQTGWGRARQFEFFRALLTHLKTVDVVHFAHTPTRINGLFLRALKRFYPNVTFVQTITGFDHGECGNRSLYWGDVITTISGRVQAALLEHHGITAALLTPYPRPDRLARSAPLPQHLIEQFDNWPVVVFPVDVFRLDLEQFNVAAICGALIERQPTIRLVFLDRFGAETKIRDLLSHLPEENLCFLPVIDYMGALIKRADVVAFPMSDVDGKFNPPMVLLEAEHFGRPVVCSNNIDLPASIAASRLADWNSSNWATAISDALQSKQAAATTDFERNCYRYLQLYRSGLPTTQTAKEDPVSMAMFIARLGEWARSCDLPIFHRPGGLDDVDFSGSHDVDIWVRSIDSGALEAFLDTLSATRIIRRRALNWTNQDVYIIQLAEGCIQLDVGVGRISTGEVAYTSLDDLAGNAGLVELPGDVEIFARGVKKQVRGEKFSESDFLEYAAIFANLDEAASNRMQHFYKCDATRLSESFATPVKSSRVRRLFRSAIRRSMRIASAHPLEFFRVGGAKLSWPFWPKPFGRRTKGQIVAIIGTDGTGKSTTQELLRSSLQNNGYRPRYVYMGRARGNMVVSDKLKEKAESAYRKSSGSWLKYVASWVYLFDYLARFAKIFYLSRVQGETILCDRYYFDIQLMERYSRIAYRLLSFSAPKPDVLLVLDCSVATLMSRKAERTPDEYERQRQFYRDIALSAKVRLWRGVLDTDALDAKTIESIVSGLIYRASHRGYDY